MKKLFILILLLTGFLYAQSISTYEDVYRNRINFFTIDNGCYIEINSNIYYFEFNRQIENYSVYKNYDLDSTVYVSKDKKELLIIEHDTTYDYSFLYSSPEPKSTINNLLNERTVIKWIK